MASTGVDRSGLQSTHAQKVLYTEKYPVDETGIEPEAARPYSPGAGSSLQPVYDSTHRKLKPRHIQLIGIGGYVVLSWIWFAKTLEGARALMVVGCAGQLGRRYSCRLVSLEVSHTLDGRLLIVRTGHGLIQVSFPSTRPRSVG